MVNKSKITRESTFNGDYFGIEVNHESNNSKKNIVLGILSDL